MKTTLVITMESGVGQWYNIWDLETQGPVLEYLHDHFLPVAL